MSTIGEAPANNRTAADGAAAVESIVVEALESVFNGATYDRKRANWTETLAASAAQSGTTNHQGTNYNHAAALIVVDATASTGDNTEDLDISIQILDPASSKWITVISDASAFANGATGTLLFGVGSGLSDSQTVLEAVEEIPLPRDYRVQTVVQQGGGGTPTYTYSVGVMYVSV